MLHFPYYGYRYQSDVVLYLFRGSSTIAFDIYRTNNQEDRKPGKLPVVLQHRDVLHRDKVAVDTPLDLDGAELRPVDLHDYKVCTLYQR